MPSADNARWPSLRPPMLFNNFAPEIEQVKPGDCTVLIIDDSKLFQRTVRKLVEQAGGAVISVAENGAFGADMALSLKPDVIILDHHMPEMNGLECLRAIRMHESR